MDMACSGEARRALASELDQLRAIARELEAHVDRGSPAARELCGALASSVDKAIVRLAGCPPKPAAGDALGNASKSTTQLKKKKGMAKVRRQVRVRSVQDVAPLDDGLSWRKYGQKDILGAKYPRAYFRCTHRHTQGCHATKQVQRADGDPLLFDVVYLGAHTCVAQRVGDGGARRLRSAEQLHRQQPAAGQEQSSPLAAGTEGIQWLEPMTPFSFPSSPAGTGTSSGAFNCCFPLASPASSECQISSGYDYAARGFEAGMDFEAQLDEWFSNPSEFFQPEIQNL